MVTALFNRRLAKLADEKGIELPEDMLVIETFWEEKVILSKVRRSAKEYVYFMHEIYYAQLLASQVMWIFPRTGRRRSL